MGLRSLRPRPMAAGESDVVPNENDPASVPPSTVGPDQLVVPGDPQGVTMDDPGGPAWSPPRIVASGWSGWPDEWATPRWTDWQPLVDIAWNCINKNANVLATMPPYLVGAASTLNADWLTNPNPDLYGSWEAFCKELFWAYQMGEAFVISDARYATGWPARFHVVPATQINVEMDVGRRRYTIGGAEIPDGDILHIRYQGSVDDAHGHGPLEAGRYRLAAAQSLLQYGTKLAASGGIPIGVLESQEEISPDQALLIQQRWVERRMSSLGEPAVLDKGLQWKPSQISPTDLGLVELEQYHAGQIANLFDVPAWVVNLPNSDSMTYANVNGQTDFWWRMGLKPKAQFVMSELSGWALPRGTRVELNRDEFIQPGPYERAQTYQILAAIVDPVTGQQAATVDEIRAKERFDQASHPDVASGVLR